MPNLNLSGQPFKLIDLNNLPTDNLDLLVIVVDKFDLTYIFNWLDPNGTGLKEKCENLSNDALISLPWVANFPNTQIDLCVVKSTPTRDSQQWIKLIRTLSAALTDNHKNTALIAPALVRCNLKNLYLQLGLEIESATYRYLAPYHTNISNKKCKTESVQIFIDEQPDIESLHKGQHIGEGVNSAKLLGDLPSNICDPAFIQDKSEELADQYDNLSVEVLDENDLLKEGMHSFLSVGKGSIKSSRLICLHYNNSQDAPLVLVGKGITFDTGGISLKPGAGMDEMKYDMCGSASVFGTIQAVAKMQLPINIVGLMALAENMPSSSASKPGDVVSSKSGLTIEILNTDAEGRMVLCDTITYSKKYNPKWVIDIATLTGACVIALGHEVSAVYCDDTQLRKSLLQAGEQTGDRGWPMPMFEEYDKQIKSRFADIANIGGRPAGSITAAMFLKKFADDLRWAHLDIAGTAWSSGGKKAASGRPVPMLSQLCLQIADDKI